MRSPAVPYAGSSGAGRALPATPPPTPTRSRGGWTTLTYAEASQRVLEIAAGFAALGLEPGESVALMMVNSSEHVLADLGAVHAGGVRCTVYSTFAPDQIAFVADDVGARIAVLGGPAELARWEPVLGELPGLRKIIMLEGAPDGDDRFMSLAGLPGPGPRARSPPTRPRSRPAGGR